MQELEKILEEINAEFDRRIGTRLKIIAGTNDDVYRYGYGKSLEAYQQGKLFVEDNIRKHMGNDGWIPVEERMPDNRRSNYEVTFINECGYEEHGFSQWYDGEFHIPAVVIAWREHLKPYRPERSEEE